MRLSENPSACYHPPRGSIKNYRRGPNPILIDGKSSPLLAKVSNNIRVNYLTTGSIFEADSVESEAWLISLIQGKGLVELTFTRSAWDFLNGHTTAIFMLSGFMSAIVGDSINVPRLGEIVLVRSNHNFRLRLSSHFKYLILFIPNTELDLACPSTRLIDNTPISSLYGPGSVLGGALRGIATSLFVRSERYDISPLKSAIVTLVSTAFAEHTKTGVPSAKKLNYLEIVKDWVERNIDHANLTLADAANAAHTSKRTLQRQFSRRGTSFKRFLRDIRVATAAERLADPSQQHRSINEIALGCGFATASHFAKTFRDTYGTTASEYRNLRSGPDINGRMAR